MRLIWFSLVALVLVTTAAGPLWALDINDQALSCPIERIKEETAAHQIDLRQYRGQVVYLDFWATWCPPCKKSMPFLNALRNELNPQGFEIVAVSVDENIEDARRFLQKFPVDYVVASDPDGHCPREYDVKAMPSAYLIDREGIIRYVHLGFRESDEEEIRSQVLQLLAENQTDRP